MKLTDQQAEDIYAAIPLTEDGRAFVRAVRAGNPDRDPNSNTSRTGRIASAKMGHAVRSESASGEVVAIGEYESDDEVLEYWDQIAVVAPYAPPGTDHTTVRHTIDFVLIRKHVGADDHVTYSVEAEEWREPARMRKLALGDPARWVERPDGDWTQVPVERWLHERGIGYRIRTIGSIPALRAANHKLLADYRITPHPFSGDVVSRALDAVARRPAITLAELLRTVEGVGVDDAFALIAQGSLKANLDAALLTDHEHVHLYEEGPLTQTLRRAEHHVDRGEVRLDVDARVRLFGAELRILAVTPTHVHLNGDRYESLRIEDFNRLVAEGHLVGLVDTRPDTTALLLKYSAEKQAKATRKLAVLQPYLEGATYPEHRTHQRWLADYRQAELDYGPGSGVLGLLDDSANRGNYDPRLSDAQEEDAAECIRRFYLNPDQLTKKDAFLMHEVSCGKKDLAPISRATFYRRMNGYRLSEIAQARWGKRAAYAAAPPQLGRSEDPTLPTHGEHVQARVHMDHSQAEVETVDAVSGVNLGIPNITLAIDEKSRMVTAAVLLYEDPSSRSDMLAFREHVRSTGRLPTTVVTDNGADFRSEQFQSFCTLRGVSLEYRKSGDARDGSPVEGGMKQIMHDLLWRLRGNRRPRKDVRKLDKENDPALRAVYTFTDLQAAVDGWVEIYNRTVIPTLGGSPKDLYEQDLKRAGSRPGRAQPYTIGFRALTALEPEHGREVKIDREGVRINHLQYWCDAFLLPGVQGTKVKVRYEPLNARVGYALVKGVWHDCTARAPELEGRTDKEIKALSVQLRRRLARTPSPREMAEYIYALKTREDELATAQRERLQRRDQFAVLDAKEHARGQAEQGDDDQHEDHADARQDDQREDHEHEEVREVDQDVQQQDHTEDDVEDAEDVDAGRGYQMPDLDALLHTPPSEEEAA